MTNSDQAPLLTEREQVRARLKASVDALTEQTNLHTQMQKEPVKMLGGASAVGAVLGLVLGRQLRRSKKIYVDSNSPDKHQKALIKAQQKAKSPSIGGSLLMTLGTLAVKTVADKVIIPKLEIAAQGLLDQIEQGEGLPTQVQKAALKTPAVPKSPPVVQSPASRFVKKEVSSVQPVIPSEKSQKSQNINAKASHAGVVPMPASKVEAKAKSSHIAAHELENPNYKS